MLDTQSGSVLPAAMHNRVVKCAANIKLVGPTLGHERAIIQKTSRLPSKRKTFVQRCTNVFDVGPNVIQIVLCMLGD